MARGKCFLLIFCLVYSPLFAMAQYEDNYKPHGATESISFEMGLHTLEAGSELVVPPKAAILASSIPQERIPAKYVQEAERSLAMVLQPAFLPESTQTLVWRGLPAYYYNWDVIVADYAVPANSIHVYLTARARGLNITVRSSLLFTQDADKLTNDGLIKEIVGLLKIPAEKIPKLEVETKTGDAGGTPTRIDRIRCEFNERTSSVRSQEWWSLIVCVVTQGVLSVQLSTHDWKGSDLPASALDPWRLEDIKR